MSKVKYIAAGILVVLVLVLFGCEEGFTSKGGFGAKASVGYLRCEYLVDPLGIDTTAPRLSWIMKSSNRGQKQIAYQILVADSPEVLAQNEGNLWNSGKMATDKSNQIIYGGKPLKSQMQCWWKVRVWDLDEKISAWSKPASWTMGLLEKDEWKAKWIGLDKSRERISMVSGIKLEDAKWVWYPDDDPKDKAPIGSRFFRKSFDIPADVKVEQAFCAVTADNQYTVYINGEKVGNGSNFKSAGVVNVTDKIQEGKNVVAVEAANVGEDPNPAGMLAVLRIVPETGDPIVINSDAGWICADKGGEDWLKVDADDSAWQAAKVLGDYGCKPWDKIELNTDQVFLPPIQFLRKAFVVDRPVRRATVYASALGDYDLQVNGKKVDNTYFTPGWTDYNIRVYYNTYDVTKLIEQGGNAIGAMLGDGWYSGYVGFGHKRDHYGQNTRLALQLHLVYEDGTSEIITTNESWRATTGPILEGDFLMGETYDARMEMPGWCTGDFDDSGWETIDVNDSIPAKIEAYPGVHVREFQEIKPVGITEPKPGAYVFDMGTNFAGFARLKVKAPQGTKVVMRYAERLNPDGTIYITNLRSARATDTYICKGDGVETWQPRFTFHGFQYVEVTGYPDKPKMDAITGIELTSATPVVGSFKCSDKTANILYHNICQTQRANFIEIPTDCPQRDERLGWTGDAQIYVRTATYNSDVAAFFNKWLVDLEDAQSEKGDFPDVAPRKVATGGGTAAWGDAGVICPWTIYLVYGDTRVLEEHYDAMERWVEYCKGTTKDLLRPASGYGDWLSIKADTPKDVLATAYFAYSTKLTAKTAKVLGKDEDAAKYEKLFDDIKQAFNKAYVGEDGKIKGETQTVYVLALAFDLLDEDKRPAAVEYLVKDIESKDWHLSTGFVGTKDLMQTLMRFGQTDVAYKLFHNDTFPSWGFSIRHGATSIWERWDGWTPEKGFQDPGMNSFAHYSFGAVAEWMFKTIAGIDTDGAGYKNIIIKPRPGGNLTHATTSYDSIYGKIATSWKVKGSKLQLEVTIPSNTMATIYVPATDIESVKEGWGLATKSKGLAAIGMEGDCAVFTAGGGQYKFTSKLP